METYASLGTVLALAFLCESLTEYLFEDLFKGFGLDTRYLRYISALAGVVLCLAFGVDLFRNVLGLRGYGVVGEVLTGLVLGRGSNYVHDFYSRFFVKKGEG